MVTELLTVFQFNGPKFRIILLINLTFSSFSLNLLYILPLHYLKNFQPAFSTLVPTKTIMQKRITKERMGGYCVCLCGLFATIIQKRLSGQQQEQTQPQPPQRTKTTQGICKRGYCE